MLFSSNVFLFAYLPLVLVLYYISPRPLRNPVLLIVSLFFYGWKVKVSHFSTFSVPMHIRSAHTEESNIRTKYWKITYYSSRLFGHITKNTLSSATPETVSSASVQMFHLGFAFSVRTAASASALSAFSVSNT